MTESWEAPAAEGGDRAGGLVVVGFDGSDGSQRALRWAVEEARARGLRLRAVIAWSYLDQPGADFDPAYGEAAAARVLDEALREALAGAQDDLPVERRVVCELPARALLDEARDAELVVLGSRGLGGFRGLLMGSVSQHVAHHAPCPVVIVPGPERAGRV